MAQQPSPLARQRGFTTFEALVVLLGCLAIAGLLFYFLTRQEPPDPPLSVHWVEDLPIAYDTLVTMDDNRYVIQGSNIVTHSSGALTLRSGTYYQQIWLEGQEDAIWVFRRNTSVHLSGNTILITDLERRE